MLLSFDFEAVHTSFVDIPVSIEGILLWKYAA